MDKRLLFLFWLVVGACQFVGEGFCAPSHWLAYNKGLSDDNAYKEAIKESLRDWKSYNKWLSDEEAYEEAIKESLRLARDMRTGDAHAANAQAVTCCTDPSCSICFEEFETLGDNREISILPCKHSFCTGCINGWLAAHDTCPNCRYKINRSRIITGLYGNLKPRSEEQRQAAVQARGALSAARPPEPVRDNVDWLTEDFVREDEFARDWLAGREGFEQARPTNRIPWERIDYRRKPGLWQRAKNFFGRLLF